MSSTSVGRAAETRVAEYLKRQGYKLIAQNWRTRFCEIDLVMQKKRVIYFIEVKYRSSRAQGEGEEYVTARKLKQMQFAAEYWLEVNDWSGNASLLVVSVDGAEISTINVEQV